MTQEKDKLLDHDYDGIQEYDNPLPNWWLWLFYGTIIFSVIYFPYYHFFGGKLQEQEYAEEMAEAAVLKAAKEVVTAKEAAIADKAGPATIDIGEGNAIYVTNCVACHGALGEGGIGPNLTDNHWIHGNTVEELEQVTLNGVPDKGMISWKAILGPGKIKNVIAYIQTLKGTNPPNSKAPQGQEYPE